MQVQPTFNLAACQSKPGQCNQYRYQTTGLMIQDVYFGIEKRFFWYPKTSRLALKPIQPPLQRILELFPKGINWPGLEGYHSPPSSIRVKNGWGYTSTSCVPFWHSRKKFHFSSAKCSYGTQVNPRHHCYTACVCVCVCVCNTHTHTHIHGHIQIQTHEVYRSGLFSFKMS